MPSRRLYYVKIVQGERREKEKAEGFAFSMPSRSLYYVKIVASESLKVYQFKVYS